MPPAKRRPKRIWKQLAKNLRKRWFQVILMFIGFGFVLWGTHAYLAPKPPKGDVGYKYLFCEVCKLEIPYNKEAASKLCPRCKPPKVGPLKPTKQSQSKGGDGNPWKWWNITIGIESFLFLGVLYFVLSRKGSGDADLDFQHQCFHCKSLLRYKADGHGMYTHCPSCSQVLKLPDADEAMTAEDRLDATSETFIEGMRENFRQSGIDLPTDEDDEAESEAKTEK